MGLGQSSIVGSDHLFPREVIGNGCDLSLDGITISLHKGNVSQGISDICDISQQPVADSG